MHLYLLGHYNVFISGYLLGNYNVFISGYLLGHYNLLISGFSTEAAYPLLKL